MCLSAAGFHGGPSGGGVAIVLKRSGGKAVAGGGDCG